MTNNKRQASGQPSGGQFAAHPHDEASVVLATETIEFPPGLTPEHKPASIIQPRPVLSSVAKVVPGTMSAGAPVQPANLSDSQPVGRGGTAADVELHTPHDAQNDPSGQNRAAEGAPGTWGATAGHWTRLDRAVAALEAPPARRLTKHEQMGWDSLDGIESKLNVAQQPFSWCAWQVGESLRFAKTAAEHDKDTSREYWDARIDRLTTIKDVLWGLADEDTVAAEQE